MVDGLPQLWGKHYYAPGVNGPVLCFISDVQVGVSKSGAKWIDQIKVTRQKISPQGFASWSTPRWISYGRHIQQRIDAYEQQPQPDGAA